MINRRLALISADRVRIPTTVSMEHDDTIFMGEVVACTQDCDQNWHMELRVEQVLNGLRRLRLQREMLMGEFDASVDEPHGGRSPALVDIRTASAMLRKDATTESRNPGRRRTARG
jgi:hypothetical protein